MGIMSITEHRRKVASHLMGPAFVMFVVVSIIRGLTITPYPDLAMVLLGIFVSPIAVYLCWRIFGWDTKLAEKLRLSKPAVLYTAFMLCFYASLGTGILFYTNFVKKKPGSIPTAIIQVSLSVPPEFEFRGKDRNYGDVVITTTEYPDFEFTLANKHLPKSDFNPILDELKEGFVVDLRLEKSAYEMKLAKTLEPDFMTKYFSYHQITVYGLWYQQRQYLNFAVKEPQFNFTQLWIFNGVVFALFVALPLGLIIWLRKRWVDSRYYRRKQKWVEH